jgi:hypothetical protein
VFGVLRTIHRERGDHLYQGGAQARRDRRGTAPTRDRRGRTELSDEAVERQVAKARVVGGIHPAIVRLQPAFVGAIREPAGGRRGTGAPAPETERGRPMVGGTPADWDDARDLSLRSAEC